MSHHRAIPLLAILSAAVVGAGCSRTPPEPAPASSVDVASLSSDRAPASASSASAATGLATASASKRAASAHCISATPETPPAMPAPASAAACPPDPEGIPKADKAQVAFPDAPGNPKVEVELAQSEHDIQRGLMYRRTMPEEHGMLFRLGERRDHTFWMHNTCMPLDMLFVDDDGLIVGIVEGAKPLDDGTRSVGCPSTLVLEVNAGWCRRHGVRAGQKMGIPSAAR